MATKEYVLFDTETTGLANDQQDISKGFGVLQLSAIKLAIDDNGHIAFKGALDMVVDPAKTRKDGKPELVDMDGNPRLPYYHDYQTLSPDAFAAFEEAFLGDYGLLNCRIDNVPSVHNGQEINVNIVPHTPPEGADYPATNPSTYVGKHFEVKNGTRDAASFNAAILERLDMIARIHSDLGDTEKAAEIIAMRSKAAKAFEDTPYFSAHAQGAYFAARAMGVASREEHVAKAQSLGQERLYSYDELVEKFNAFSQTDAGQQVDGLIAHNAPFDIGMMRRVYKAAGAGDFPFSIDKTIDTVALSGSVPERSGKRNGIDSLIADGDITAEAVTSIDGLNDDAIRNLLHKAPNEPLLARLSAAADGEHSAHDALEDVIISAGLIANKLPRWKEHYGGNGLISIHEMLGRIPGMPEGVEIIKDREAFKKRPIAEKLETGMIATLPLSKMEKAGRTLLYDYLYLGQNSDIKRGDAPALFRQHEQYDDPLVNIQKLRFTSLNPLMHVRHLPGVSSVHIPERDGRGRTNTGGDFTDIALHIAPPEEGRSLPDQLDFKVIDLLSSLPALLSPDDGQVPKGFTLTDENPARLRQDLHFLHNARKLVGGKFASARFQDDVIVLSPNRFDEQGQEKARASIGKMAENAGLQASDISRIHDFGAFAYTLPRAPVLQAYREGKLTELPLTSGRETPASVLSNTEHVGALGGDKGKSP